MPETKPFISHPVWANSRYGRQYWGRKKNYYTDVKKICSVFPSFWKCLFRHRSIIRMLKFFIIFALLLTCVFNLHLAAKAKLKYERYKVMFMEAGATVPSDRDFDHKHPNFAHSEKIEISVLSSRDEVEVVVNGHAVLHLISDSTGRGLHVVVLNQFSGVVTAQRLFDTYIEGEDRDLKAFLRSIKDENRILVFAVKDEASFHLETDAKKLLRGFGSNEINSLHWRGMWACVMSKSGTLFAEDLTHSEDTASWASPVRIDCIITAKRSTFSQDCHWPSTPENMRRKEFCARYDGYDELCNCDFDLDFHHKRTNFTPNHVYDIPVVVIASNRPFYLYRMLTSLLAAAGANPDKVTVFIDGQYEEPMAVAKLLGVEAAFHLPKGIKNARISQNYKDSLSATFKSNPDSKYAMVLEEDLDVSPDFFSFFSQTLHLMENDPSIFCISAWNDQGYEHSCQDPGKLYRVETFPGLGWLLSRKLFEEELEPSWPGPDKLWDWDMWLRTPTIQKERECIIPDVSRTYHFGTTGINMNTYFHQMYFSKHKINHLANVKLKDLNTLTKDAYETMMHLLVRESEVVNHQNSPCGPNFIDQNHNAESFVSYIQIDQRNIQDQFKKLFKCLKLWDLDVRGLHKHSLRIFRNGKPVIFVAYPISPYSIYKPVDAKPIVIDEIFF